MKTLIIFYSLDGNTKFIAEHLATKIKADLLQLYPKKEISHTGFMKYFRGGRQVFMKTKPELEERTIDPNEYETIIFWTPVRAFSYVPALRSFFDQVKLQNKNIALFCCHGGGKEKTLEKMEQGLKGNNIIGKTDFLEPLKKNKEEVLKKADERIKSIWI